MKKLVTLAAAILAVSIASEPAHAFRTRTCNTGFNTVPVKMPGSSVTFRYSADSFPSTGGWLDGLKYTVNQFNRNPSNFTLKLAADTTTPFLLNGESEVWGSTDQLLLHGAPAVAYSFFDCNLFSVKMNEGDVIFDFTDTSERPFQWTASQQKSDLWSYTNPNGKRMMQATALHEFGHATGLLHETRFYNVMGADFSHVDTVGSTVNAYVGEDTGNGLVSLYGLWADGPLDLAVAHWRRTGDDGEYSMHGRTRILATTGIELSKSMISFEPRYNVTRGNPVRVEFTFENLGRATVSNVPVKFYISTNETISVSDREIGSVTLSSLARDTPSTLQHTVTIPADLSPNTAYWLGVMVNPGLTISENYIVNNNSYIRIRTN
jgi:hypothetical protein